MFGPLRFPQLPRNTSTLFPLDFKGDNRTTCMLCELEFNLPSKQDDFFKHLFQEHRLVIADTHHIASLKSYIVYWRVRFKSNPLSEFCSTMLLDCKPDGTVSQQEQYFLLSDVVQEDKELREGLQKKRLEWVLEQQAEERSSVFSRECLFCKLEFNSSRSDYFTHLSEKHNLQLGCPENLVFCNELLDTIENKLNRLECLYCEKIFKDRTVLKEHMRKKKHKRINPENKVYDRFYIINYLEMGKTWQQVQSEPEEKDLPEDTSSDWTEWSDTEGLLSEASVCLYCDEMCPTNDEILQHMINRHDFNFEESCRNLNLNFYDQVKLVNYIRKQIFFSQCTNCEEKFSSRDDLLKHMEEKQHFVLPAMKLWNQPEFYFPTYENDAFLCYLNDIDADEQPLCDMMQAFPYVDTPKESTENI